MKRIDRLKALAARRRPPTRIEIRFKDMSPKPVSAPVEGTKAVPRPLGIPERTIAVRRAVQRATETVATKLVRCDACGMRSEIPVDAASVCACGRGLQ